MVSSGINKHEKSRAKDRDMPRVSTNKYYQHSKLSKLQRYILYFYLLRASKVDHKRRKNRKELNSFQENVEGLSSD